VLYPGNRVRVHGLTSAPQYNGREGLCEHWDTSTGRMQVRLKPDEELVGVKPRYLRKVVVERHKAGEDEQMNRVLEIFQGYDTDGDGIIDGPEFEVMLNSLGLDQSVFHAFLASMDKNRDGLIQYEEFVNWAMEQPNKMHRKSLATKLEVYWPQPSGDRVDIVGADNEEPEEIRDLTVEELERTVGRLEDAWPPHAITIVNNMRHRFPEYPIEGIVFMMRQNDFIGGKVMHAIRLTGAKELEVVTPSTVRLRGSGSFPAEYRVRSPDEALQVYRQIGSNWSFHNLRDGQLTAVGSFAPRSHFRILEVRRGTEYGFYFGLVEFGSTSGYKHWVNLGLEMQTSSWLNNDRNLDVRDLQYSEAERILGTW